VKRTRLIVPLGGNYPSVLEEYDDAVPDAGGETEQIRTQIHEQPGSGDQLQQPSAKTGGGVSSVQAEASGEPAEGPPPESREPGRNDE